jgi:hypothetical protein
MIYLSGAITHIDPEIMRQNIARFHEVEKVLGVDCFNPASLEQDLTYEQFMVIDILYIVENKPDMYMLTGWQDSRGARLEHTLALQLKLNIQYEK